ncbi:uncharacterized protein F21D5.5-like [Gigantopelta aegis]|uniref:uncharacterized protein F21D5.5-like n=1 Tax=Gigantopelta aegis TaxID=1735272 RepID=UPI001B8888DA|nr:uncharacterized protein F21D5.5-like [Gigantopelta aegis]
MCLDMSPQVYITPVGQCSNLIMKLIARMSARSKNLKRKAVENTALAVKKAKGETDLAHGLKWAQVGQELKGLCPLISLSSDSLPGRTKVVGFDIDFTVIKTASGRKFATGAKDWEWWDEMVPAKLKSLDADGYRVVFFTNQAGIEKQKTNPNDIKDKIEDIIKQLSIPVQAFICTGTNHYRKPGTLMWDYFVDNCNGGIKVDVNKSIFVGDAAGRAKAWAAEKPKDFSCSDRMFAANIGIKFYTPEEYFMSESAAPFKWGSLDAEAYLKIKPVNNKTITYHSESQEIVIMVGPPASGKSSLRKRYFEPQGYVAVNKDTMGTQAKCVKVAKEALAKGKSVVVDNTNPNKSTRKDFLDLAEKEGIPCRCFVMQTPLDVAHHLNLVRQNMTNGEVRRVPDVGYAVYNKNFETPSKCEGFLEIVNIDFTPQFDNKRHEVLFKHWTGH